MPCLQLVLILRKLLAGRCEKYQAAMATKPLYASKDEDGI